MSKKMRRKMYSFVGKFFHSLDENGCIKWQGYIVDEVRKGLFIIQTFDWLMGDRSPEKQMVSLDEMKNWFFYEDGDSMRYSYEYGVARLHTSSFRAEQEERKKKESELV